MWMTKGQGTLGQHKVCVSVRVNRYLRLQLRFCDFARLCPGRVVP
jgi:hypothetical protein